MKKTTILVATYRLPKVAKIRGIVTKVYSVKYGSAWRRGELKMVCDVYIFPKYSEAIELYGSRQKEIPLDHLEKVELEEMPEDVIERTINPSKKKILIWHKLSLIEQIYQ